jgi:hypothetical protein
VTDGLFFIIVHFWFLHNTKRRGKQATADAVTSA